MGAYTAFIPYEQVTTLNHLDRELGSLTSMHTYVYGVDRGEVNAVRRGLERVGFSVDDALAIAGLMTLYHPLDYDVVYEISNCLISRRYKVSIRFRPTGRTPLTPRDTAMTANAAARISSSTPVRSEIYGISMFERLGLNSPAISREAQRVQTAMDIVNAVQATYPEVYPMPTSDWGTPMSPKIQKYWPPNAGPQLPPEPKLPPKRRMKF